MDLACLRRQPAATKHLFRIQITFRERIAEHVPSCSAKIGEQNENMTRFVTPHKTQSRDWLKFLRWQKITITYGYYAVTWVCWRNPKWVNKTYR